jgi:uncharacterized protein
MSPVKAIAYRTHMKFALQAPGSANLVQACSPGEIRVGERIIRTSLILTASELVLDWPPRTVSELSPEHLQHALVLEPEVILLGTGVRQVFPEAHVLAPVHRAGVGIEVMDTRAACRTFNVLVQEGRRVAAALILDPAGA